MQNNHLRCNQVQPGRCPSSVYQITQGYILMAKDFTVTGLRTSYLTDGIMSHKALIALKTSNLSHIINFITRYNRIPADECHSTNTSLDYFPLVYHSK